MIKRPMVVMALCAVTFFGFSQQNIAEDESNTAVDFRKSLTSKVELSNIINPIDPSLLVALEYQFSSHYSFTQELGLITGYRSDIDISDGFIGFKIKEEFRYYMPHYLPEKVRPYASLSLMYRYMTLAEKGNVGYGCSENWIWSCDYIQQVNNPVNSHQYGGIIKLGIIQEVLPRLTLEGDAGISVSYLNFNRSEGSDVVYFFDENQFNNQEKGYQVLPNFSIRIGYLLSPKSD